MNAPEWFDKAFFAAAVAALGYVAKLFIELLLARRREKAKRKLQLLRLDALLKSSKAIFKTQCKTRNQLAELLNKRNVPGEEGGYEKLFSSGYPSFTPEEKELHTVIRGTTQHAMRKVNLSLLKWLKGDLSFRVSGRKGTWSKLAEQLNALEAHLLVWEAKYQVWIPNNEEHALVYLADEKQHGVGFPTGIDETVNELVQKHL